MMPYALAQHKPSAHQHDLVVCEDNDHIYLICDRCEVYWFTGVFSNSFSSDHAIIENAERHFGMDQPKCKICFATDKKLLRGADGVYCYSCFFKVSKR